MMSFLWRIVVFNVFLAFCRTEKVFKSSSAKPGRRLETLLGEVARRGADRHGLVVVARRQSEQIPSHLPEVQEHEPSCAELRTMWHRMRRMARHSEITNEIPQIPFPGGLLGYLLGHSRISQPPHASPVREQGVLLPPLAFIDKGTFGQIVREQQDDPGVLVPERGKSPQGVVIHGVQSHGPFFAGDLRPRIESVNSQRPLDTGVFSNTFTNVPIPEEALGVYGTVVLTPEEKARLDQDRVPSIDGQNMMVSDGTGFDTDFSDEWDVDDGFGTFGSFAPEEEELEKDIVDKFNYGSILHSQPSSSIRISDRPPTAVETSVGDFIGLPEKTGRASDIEDFDRFAQFGSSDVGFQDQVDCHRLEGLACGGVSNCACFGHSLQCVSGRCIVISPRKPVVIDKWGMWHSGPLDTHLLGSSRHKRGTIKTVLM